MRGDILLFIIKTTNFRTNTYIIILETLKTEKAGGEQLIDVPGSPIFTRFNYKTCLHESIATD